MEDNTFDYKAEYEKLLEEKANLKKSFDKTASDLADTKKKLAERQTDEEKRQAEIAEREEKYAKIQRENDIIRTKEKLFDTIKDKDVLTEVSTLYADGKVLEAIEKQNQYLQKTFADMENKYKEEMLKQNPTPPPQNGNNGVITKAQFDKMGYSERLKLHDENPELYKQFTN